MPFGKDENSKLPTACPKCDSKNIVLKNYARRAGTIVGGLAGGTGVAAAGWEGAQLGAATGTVAGGPVGAAAGAVIGGLVGAGFGAWIGSNLGKRIDNNVISRYKCLKCKYEFWGD